MGTNTNFAYVSGTGGALLQMDSGTTLSETRIHAIHATGVGVFVIEDVVGGVSTSKIKFINTSVTDVRDITINDYGTRFDGIVFVSAPTSSAVTVQYG